VKLLLLGAGGQVGRALIERGGAAVIGRDRARCDICDITAIRQAIEETRPSAVVNCAAYTAVDRAESEPERAFAVNEHGAKNVALAARQAGIPVIHLSTDYVYGGTNSQAQSEDEPVRPLNVYGLSKARGDSAVAAENPNHLLLRVSWVFGVYGANFAKTMLRLGREGKPVRVVNDQRGGPTEAGDIAGAILQMAAMCLRPGFTDWGTYHFTGKPATTWYGFARALLPPAQVVPISTQEYPTPAQRPRNSVLDCSKIERTFGISQPDWRVSLARVVSLLREP
jgi:dTDP-4-dehydrorhamnose reductase